MSIKSPFTRRRFRAGGGTPFGITLGTGAVVVLAAVLVAALIPATAQDWRFGVVVAAVAGFAVCSVDVRAVAVIATIGGLLVDGFLENRLGVLSWHGTADVVLLVLLTAAGAAGLLLGAGHRYIGELRSRARLGVELDALSTYFKERERHDA